MTVKELYECINEIDDEIILLDKEQAKGKRKFQKRIVQVGTALAACILIFIGITIINPMGNNSSEKSVKNETTEHLEAYLEEENIEPTKTVRFNHNYADNPRRRPFIFAYDGHSFFVDYDREYHKKYKVLKDIDSKNIGRLLEDDIEWISEGAIDAGKVYEYLGNDDPRILIFENRLGDYYYAFN